jgi:8-oxo-dGTP pyrophosphatase MutT (NUDIX family)
MRAERLRHRAVFVLVRSSDGRVLVHRRSEHKDLWPGQWDLAVGGVVGAGEGWEEAAHRELAEEVGVVVERLEPLGEGAFDDPDVSLVARVYAAVHDGPFSFADGEVVEACLVTVPELAERIGRDPFLPDSLALVAPHVLPIGAA